MNIFSWLFEELEKRRNYKLELRKCPNCFELMDLLKNEMYEREKLMDRLLNKTMVNVVGETTEQPNIENPIGFISSRKKSAIASHNSFRRVQQLKEEFEKEQELENELEKVSS